MKRLFKQGIWVGLLLVPIWVQAGRYDVEKKKVIEKQYEVSSGTRLKIDNSYGGVHVNTWNKKEISVKVEVIARRDTERRAQETLDNIEIKIYEGSGEISFETEIRSIRNGKSEEFEINYEINMPSENPLEVDLEFGDAYIGDRSGMTDFEVSYGDMKIGRLTGESNLKILFSNGDIEEVKRGEVILKYSDVDIETLGIVQLEVAFSDMELGAVGTAKLESKYSELDIGSIKGVKGYVGYSSFKLDRLEKELDIETEYAGDFKIDAISRDFSLINIEAKFDEMTLEFEEGTNATFEIKTSFCDVDFDEDDVDIHYQVKGDFKSEFRGKMGNGNGGKITINSSYGDVKFR